MSELKVRNTRRFGGWAPTVLALVLATCSTVHGVEMRSGADGAAAPDSSQKAYLAAVADGWIASSDSSVAATPLGHAFVPS